MRPFQQNITITIALNILYNSIWVILSMSWWIHKYMLVRGVFLPSISLHPLRFYNWFGTSCDYFLSCQHLTSMSQNWSHGFEIRTGLYGPTRLIRNRPWNGSFNPKTRYTRITQWIVRIVVKPPWLENCGQVSRVRPKLEK